MPDASHHEVELGLDTFGDVTLGEGGRPEHPAEVIRHVVEQGVLADEVGVSAFGVGEHHRPDFAVSSPDVVLAAIAARTTRIRLNTAVTVLSSDDPIRVHERFATLDALSSGRAEITVGRGSFIESFALFGQSLDDYEVLFEEKLDLLVRALDEGPIQWSGTTRLPLTGQRAFPPTESGRLPVWVGVGGSPESVIRAARHHLPLAVAIIGGPADRFVPLIELYRRSLVEYGSRPLPLAVHSPGHVAATDEQAREEFWPGYRDMHTRIGAERGWPPPSRIAFESEVHAGALYVGSPETVAAKIASTVTVLGATRFDLKYASGPMPHRQLMSSIALYGREVMPLVRDRLA